MLMCIFVSGEDIFTFVQDLVWTFHFIDGILAGSFLAMTVLAPRGTEADVGSCMDISWQPTSSRPLNPNDISISPHLLVPLGSSMLK